MTTAKNDSERAAEIGLSANAQADHDPLAELRLLAAALEQAFEDFPGLSLKVHDLLFGDGDLLRPGLVEFRLSTAGDAGRMTVSLHVTDRLRELVAAAAAGDLKGLAINE